MKLPSAAPGVISMVATVTGALLAVLAFRGPGASERLLQARLDQFMAMSPAERDRVIASDRHFASELSDQARDHYRELHTAVNQDPGLRERLARFYEWWSGLESDRKDSVNQLTGSERTQQINALFAADQQRRVMIDIHFDPRFFFRSAQQGGAGSGRGPTPLQSEPDLSLTVAQYTSILDQVFPVSQLHADTRNDLGQLAMESDQLLLRTLSAVESLENVQGSARLEIVRDLAIAIVGQAGDCPWKTRFSENVDTFRDSGDPQKKRIAGTAIAIQVVLFLNQSIGELGEHAERNISADTAAVVDYFESIDDASLRRELMTTTPESAGRRLERLTMLSGESTDTPERRLVQQLLRYDRRKQSLFQSLFSQRAAGGRP